jgi:hypothetical protein
MRRIVGVHLIAAVVIRSSMGSIVRIVNVRSLIVMALAAITMSV